MGFDTEIEPTFEKDGRLNSSGGFQVTPRGMVKIGQMLLQHGEWNGKQVFDRDWIKESTDALVGRGQPLREDLLRAAADHAYRRSTFGRRSPVRTLWYATAGWAVGRRVRTPAGTVGPRPYRRN